MDEHSETDPVQTVKAGGSAGLPPKSSSDLAHDDLKSHVLAALGAAASISGGRPINARAALLGAIAIARRQNMEPNTAFGKLLTLLPLPTTEVDESKPTSFDFDKPFAVSFARVLQIVRGPNKNGKSRDMWGREYVACAILCMGDPSLEEIAKENDFPMVDIQDAWFVFVTQSTSPLKKDDWKDLWKQAGVPIPDERRVRSGYLSETTKGDDKLSIEQEVQAFSQLIADSKTAPPLSLGLLGDWGAGKTFFMESLKEGVETLTGTEDYCENIAQVQFNAWHLSDANLWASVVDHIFEEVWKKVSRSGDEDTLEGTRQKVQEEIRGARGAVYEAERQLEVTLDTLHAAEEEHKILSAQLAVEKVAGSARKKALETVLHRPCACRSRSGGVNLGWTADQRPSSAPRRDRNRTTTEYGAKHSLRQALDAAAPANNRGR